MRKQISLVATLLIVLTILICIGCKKGSENTLTNPTDAIVSTTEPTVIPTSTPQIHTHTFGDWKIKKEATCTEKGEEERFCACGEKETQSIDMTAHSEVIDKAVEATCTATGLTEGKHCSVCNTTLIAQQETPFVAHTYDDKYDEECNNCGHKREADCAHNKTEVIEGKAATCTVTGLTDGKKCSVCNTVIVKQSVIPAKGHTEVVIPAVAATCVNKGLTQGKKCSVCGETTVVQQTIPQISHTYSTWSTVSDATCSYEGIQERYCSACGHTDTSYIPATGNHSYVNGSCNFCGYTPPSTSGLVYVLSSDRTYYICKGFTSFSISYNATSVVVAAYYQDKPVKHIANSAFNFCPKLKSVTLPSTITYINANAFYGCESLNSVYISSGIESIGMFAFKDCYALTDIYYDGTKAQWNAIEKDGGWDQNTGAYTIHCIEGLSYTLNDNGRGYTVSGIGSCSDKHVVIPDNYKGLPVTSIGDDAFAFCTSLTTVTIPNSVTSIGDSAFFHCTSLTTITIPNSVTSINSWAFSECTSLTTITIPNSVTSIGDNAFACCTSLTTVTIPDSVTSINIGAFYDCTSLTTITIPDSVTSINIGAFFYCTSLTTITIPDSVTSIGDIAFSECTSLTSISYNGTVAQWNAIEKDGGWDQNTGAYTIHCTDGKITRG